MDTSEHDWLEEAAPALFSEIVVQEVREPRAGQRDALLAEVGYIRLVRGGYREGPGAHPGRLECPDARVEL
jgi:hypothetical protein